MYDAGAWVLLESALADLPADLRWLFESGAVTIASSRRSTARSARPRPPTSAAAVRRQAIRSVPGLDATIEYAVAARAASTCARRIPRIPLGRAVAIAAPIARELAAQPGVVDGRCRSARSDAGRTRSATSRSSRPPSIPAAAIEDAIAQPDVVRAAAPRASAGSICCSIACRSASGSPVRTRPARAAALHGLAPDISTGSTRVARERGWRLDPEGLLRARAGDRRRHRGRDLRRARSAVHPAGDPQRRRRADGGARRAASDARRPRRHPRRPAHAHVVERRPRHDRGDGQRLPRPRLRVHGDHGSLAALARHRAT